MKEFERKNNIFNYDLKMSLIAWVMIIEASGETFQSFQNQLRFMEIE